MMSTFFYGLDVLCHHGKSEEDVQRAPAVGAKMWRLCVCFFCHALSRWRCAFEGIYFEQALCHSLCVDFHSVFTVFLSMGLPFQMC